MRSCGSWATPPKRSRACARKRRFDASTLPMSAPLTYLFVPGNRPERFDKALAAGADAIILDLEDAVSPEGKDEARAHVAAWLANHSADFDRIVVRVNAVTTSWSADDVAMLREARVRFAMLPKSENAAEVESVAVALAPGAQVLALIESALGMRDVDAIAAAKGVQRLVYGTLDYAVDLDLSGDDVGLIYAGSRIAIASRCAGIASPVAGVTAAIDDEARLLADLAFARALGFGAKLCIHPRQVAAIRKALAPTAQEIDWARRVEAAVKGSQG